jgi:hypothetical protein
MREKRRNKIKIISNLYNTYTNKVYKKITTPYFLKETKNNKVATGIDGFAECPKHSAKP